MTFMGVLAIVFITLKLCGVIDWSWWLVLLPAYIGFAIAALAVVLGVGISAFASVVDMLRPKRKHRWQKW